MLKAVLRYDNGTISDNRRYCSHTFCSVDPRTNHLRAQALYYQNIIEYLKQSEIEYDDNHVLDLIPSPNILIDETILSISL